NKFFENKLILDVKNLNYQYLNTRIQTKNLNNDIGELIINLHINEKDRTKTILLVIKDAEQYDQINRIYANLINNNPDYAKSSAIIPFLGIIDDKIYKLIDTKIPRIRKFIITTKEYLPLLSGYGIYYIIDTTF